MEGQEDFVAVTKWKLVPKNVLKCNIYFEDKSACWYIILSGISVYSVAIGTRL